MCSACVNPFVYGYLNEYFHAEFVKIWNDYCIKYLKFCPTIKARQIQRRNTTQMTMRATIAHSNGVVTILPNSHKIPSLESSPKDEKSVNVPSPKVPSPKSQLVPRNAQITNPGFEP